MNHSTLIRMEAIETLTIPYQHRCEHKTKRQVLSLILDLIPVHGTRYRLTTSVPTILSIVKPVLGVVLLVVSFCRSEEDVGGAASNRHNIEPNRGLVGDPFGR